MLRSDMGLVLKISGVATIVAGVAAVAFGSLWAPRALEIVYDGPVSWPLDSLVPFAPVFAIALGAQLLVKARR